jgi:hypothetical protein
VSRQKWIEIVGWDTFQHYTKRRPIWIKNYVALLLKDEYRELTGHQRGVLHGLWMLYALSECQLRADTASISRQLGLRVSTAQLESLNDAGFLRIRARRPLASSRARAREETETEKRKKSTSKNDAPELLSYPEFLATLHQKAAL